MGQQVALPPASHIVVPVQVLAASLAVQLPANEPRKAPEDGPSARAPALTWEMQVEFWLLVPD